MAAKQGDPVRIIQIVAIYALWRWSGILGGRVFFRSVDRRDSLLESSITSTLRPPSPENPDGVYEKGQSVAFVEREQLVHQLLPVHLQRHSDHMRGRGRDTRYSGTTTKAAIADRIRRHGVVALVPPLWRAVMDKRVSNITPVSINFRPGIKSYKAFR